MFLPKGDAPKVGSIFTNPELAATYADIAERGTGAFYRGDLAKLMVDIVRKPRTTKGTDLPVPRGYLSRSDLKDYKVLGRAPTKVTYRGYDVYGMAPSSSGGSTVGEALNILERTDFTGKPPEQVLHTYLEAGALAFADRAKYLGDPRFVDVPLPTLLSDKFAAERACAINPVKAATKPVAAGDAAAYDGICPTPAASGTTGTDTENISTTNLTVADKWGNVVEYTLTIEQTGGSGMVVPGHGFILNNELTDFSTVYDAADPNRIQPGKRPRSSMSPTIVLKDGKPFPGPRLARRLHDHHHGAADARQPDRHGHDHRGGHCGAAIEPAQHGQRDLRARVHHGVRRRADRPRPHVRPRGRRVHEPGTDRCGDGDRVRTRWPDDRGRGAGPSWWWIGEGGAEGVGRCHENRLLQRDHPRRLHRRRARLARLALRPGPGREWPAQLRRLHQGRGRHLHGRDDLPVGSRPQRPHRRGVGVRAAVVGVFTHREFAPHEGITFTANDVQDVHEEMVTAAGGKDVWVVGGGDPAGQFADAGLLDELIPLHRTRHPRRGSPRSSRAVATSCSSSSSRTRPSRALAIPSVLRAPDTMRG
ncbi:gamma-glutamyltransferase [Nocardioides sp. B-3]|uniref:gamma-glutamyltransferase n=1 Tax=Nocardioides sp. B-3 TaxID=2895565 RepID=UPI003FA53DF1